MIILKDGSPLYLQIYSQIREDIRAGKLPAGSKMVSRRKLADRLAVSLSTVDGAYAQLTAEGYLRAEPRKGYYVCEVVQLCSAHISKEDQLITEIKEEFKGIDCSIGGVDREAFPYTLWRRLLKSCFDEYDKHLLERSPRQGIDALRQSIASYLMQARSVRCHAENLIIGPGTDRLLETLAGLLPAGGRIAVENPVYSHVDRLFQRCGFRVIPIDVDRQGVPLHQLRAAEANAVYLTPSHQFPLGVSMPVTRRASLLSWAAEKPGRYIIEDDYDSEFRYGTRPIPSMQSMDPERVVYLGTFSRSVAPSLRIGYMALPNGLLSSYQKKEVQRSEVSRLEQLVLDVFFRQGEFERHVNRMRKLYQKKREFFIRCLEALEGHVEILGENAGHTLLVRLDSRTDSSQLCQAARQEGVRVYPISPYFIGEMPKMYEGKVLLGYAGLSMEQIKAAAERLCHAWRKFCQKP